MNVQDGGMASSQTSMSPSKASWNTLLKWGSKQLPFAKSEPQPDQVQNLVLLPGGVCL